MLGYLFLVISAIFGRLIRETSGICAKNVFESIIPEGKHPPGWTFNLPFDVIVGTTILTTLHYFLSYLFSMLSLESVNPLFFSNIALNTAIMLILVVNRKTWITSSIQPMRMRQTAERIRFFKWSVILLGLFGSYLMFYSFFVKEGILHSGFTVFSDFAPHTAVIHSFSRGSNYPTEYPHFAGDGINYHFFFFYLCANLQYLGMPIDFAINIPSLLGLVSFTTLLGSFGVVITRKRAVFFLAPFMLFFRSSNAIFPYLGEVYEKNKGNLPAILSEMRSKSDAFIGNMTVHDTWGFWAMNVYANQRHLLWGFSIVLILLFLFYPTIKHAPKREKPQGELFRPSVDIRIPVRFLFRYLTEKGSWRISDYGRLILAAVLFILLPYWHGSMFITALCVLFVMALFSKERLTYLITALAGIFASVIWARFFSGGAHNVANPKLLIGFLSPDPSLVGILNYLFQILGISVIIVAWILVTEKAREKRVFILASISPIVFAFTISLTPDVGVNHKYILASYALMNLFVAGWILQAFSWSGEYIKHFIRVCQSIGITRRKRVQSGQNGKENRYLLFRGKDTRNLLSKTRVLSGTCLGSVISGVVVLVLCFCIFSTGIMDLIVYHNKNQNHFRVDLNSPLIRWIEENTDPKDVFLTDRYSMHEFFFSGRKILYGWPYYTWSAGHDTVERKEIVTRLFQGYDRDIGLFLETARKYQVKYAIIDNGLLNNQEYVVDLDFFREHFDEVFSLPEKGGLFVYQLYDD
jgi:hypothetical protein